MTAKMVWEYVNHGLNTVPDYGTGNWPAEADGCIKCEIITEVSKRVVFVEICRAIGILARLNPVTGKEEMEMAMHFVAWEQVDELRIVTHRL